MLPVLGAMALMVVVAMEPSGTSTLRVPEDAIVARGAAGVELPGDRDRRPRKGVVEDQERSLRGRSGG